MIVAWNGHMQKVFIPSLISYLYETMSVWMNKFTCPGFVLCPLKPHPKGNKYHTICCGESGIIYGWEIFELKYHPIPLGRPEFYTSPNKKTVVLMLWLIRSLWSTGKVVIIYSGFFVFKVLLETRRRGVNGILLMKKRLYWTRGFHWDETNDSFRAKNIGDLGCISGEWDDTEFNIFVLKDPGYNIIIMSKTIGFGCAGGSEVREKDGEWGGSLVQVSWMCLVSLQIHVGGGQSQCLDAWWRD